MGYKIVAVNPLKSFPIPSYGLANVAGLEDTRKQIFEKFIKMAQMKIDACDAYIEVNGGQKLNSDGRAEIFSDYGRIAQNEFEKFEEERWPKIEPALKLHLARQERRQAHFNVSCRFLGCDNPHPLGTAYFRRFGRDASRGSSTPKSTSQAAVQGTKRHSPQFFCGSHHWVMAQMNSEDYEMLSDPKNRVEVV